MDLKELQPDELYRPCNPDDFKFQTTAELEDLPDEEIDDGEILEDVVEVGHHHHLTVVEQAPPVASPVRLQKCRQNLGDEPWASGRDAPMS